MATSRIPGILDHRSVGENLNDGTLVRKTSPRPAYVGAYVGLNHGSLAARPPTTPHHRRKTLLLLQQGSNGDDVRKLQQLLNDRMDPSPHLKVDGIFGPQTKAVVIQFQRGARIIADGMLGRKTWFYLLNGKKIRTNPPAPDTNTIAGIFPRPVPVTTTGMIPVWQRPLQDRFTEVMRRTAPKLTGSLRREFEALLSPASLTIIGTTLGLWAAGHIFGVSEVVDMVLLIGGVAYLGTSVFTAAHELHDFLEITSGAADEKDLDTAASHLANAIAIIGVTAFTLLLAKIARSKGGGGDGVVGRDEAGSAVANSSPLPKSARLEPLKERPTTGELSSPESKEKSFFKGTGKSVNPNRLSRTPSEQTAWDIMNRQGRNPRQIRQVLESGAEFKQRQFQQGEKLFGFVSKAKPGKSLNSPYWTDKSTFQRLEQKYFKNGKWDSAGVKNELALPCVNSADSVVETTVIKSHIGVESKILPAKDKVYTLKPDGSVSQELREMIGGETQVTPSPDAIGPIMLK